MRPQGFSFYTPTPQPPFFLAMGSLLCSSARSKGNTKVDRAQITHPSSPFISRIVPILALSSGTQVPLRTDCFSTVQCLYFIVLPNPSFRSAQPTAEDDSNTGLLH